MLAAPSNLYNHDGMSFLSFRLALSWPYCAHFSTMARCGEGDGAMSS